MAMRGFKVGLATVVAAVGMFVGGTGMASAHESHALVRFDSMTTVTQAETKIANDRGIVGGGLPWAITSGTGELDRNGMLHVSVTGLVIPVAPFNGVNPIGSFGAIVSCITKQHMIDNVFVGTFPTNPAGNATIDAQVALPHPCTHPIVFVTSPTGAWFAMSNRADDEGDD
jgi:hypothetical protein